MSAKNKKVRLSKFSENFELLQEATTGGFGSLFLFIFKWSRSVYKLLWADLLIYLILYIAISLSYRFAINDDQKITFERVIVTVSIWLQKLPVTFLLGFYVSNVVSRWLNTYSNIPRMGGFALALQTSVNNPAKNRAVTIHLRRLISRYVNLAWLMGMRADSQLLHARFKITREQRLQMQPFTKMEYLAAYLRTPNHDPVVQKYYGQLITDDEVEVLLECAKEKNAEPEAVCLDATEVSAPDWWLPLHWAGAVIDSAYHQGYITDGDAYQGINNAINGVRAKVASMMATCAQPLPLVYHQVVIIATYAYYFGHIIGRQFLIPSRMNNKTIHPYEDFGDKYTVDYYFPIFAFLEILFVLGWFKIAFVILNPFGDDDEDFDFSAMFNNHLRNTSVFADAAQHLYPVELHPAMQNPETFDPAPSMVENESYQSSLLHRKNAGFDTTEF